VKVKYNGWEEDTEVVSELNEDAIQKQREMDKELEALYTPQAVKALTVIKDLIVKRGIANANDTQVGIGIKQGNLDMILELLNNAERINNGG